MILKRKTRRGTSRRQAKLINNLLPHLIIRYSLASPLLAHRFIELVQVEFLAADLGDLYLRYPF